MLFGFTGSKNNGEVNNGINSESEGPKKGGVGEDGEAKGDDWRKGKGPGARGALLWAGLFNCSNSRAYEAYFLGTELGCDGAHMFLSDLSVLLFGIHVLPKDINRTHLPGLFPKQIQEQATASHEDLQPWHSKVQRPL